MIELNLSPTKKQGGITNVGGIDLSLINVKMMVIALGIWFIPEPFLVDMWDAEKASYDKQYQTLNAEFRKLSQKVRGMQNVQKQVDALKEQEEKLAKKLGTVKKIINKRQNPYEILKYVAENIPKEVWLDSVELQDKTLILMGYAKKYQDIGSFLNSLKNSIFFQGVSYDKPQGMKDVINGQKVEIFRITTTVVRFK